MKKGRKKDKKKKKSERRKKLDVSSFLEKSENVNGFDRGTYGKVYKAIEKNTGKEVAVKIIPIDENTDLSEVEKEISVLKKCKSEYIVQYIDSFVFSENKTYWIVLEYCEMGSVDTLMNILEFCLEEKHIAYIMKATLNGLIYLHTRKHIHRDIKAGNLLLTDKGEIKLGDFGVCAELSNTLSKRKTVIGTPYWMAPEVIEQTEYDEKADIWSTGITIIEMAEGKPPLSEIHPLRAIFMIPFKPSPKLKDPSNWSIQLVDFVKKCLFKNANQRPTAKQLLKHPFMKKAPGREILVPLIEQVKNKFQSAGGREEFFKKEMERHAQEAKENNRKPENYSLSTSELSHSTDSDSDMTDSDDDYTPSSVRKGRKGHKESESEDSDSEGYNSTVIIRRSFDLDNEKKKEKNSDLELSDDSDSDLSDSEGETDNNLRGMKKRKILTRSNRKIQGAKKQLEKKESGLMLDKTPFKKAILSLKERGKFKKLFSHQMKLIQDVNDELCVFPIDKIGSFLIDGMEHILENQSRVKKRVNIEKLEKYLNVFDQVKNKKIVLYYQILNKFREQEEELRIIVVKIGKEMRKFTKISKNLAELQKLIRLAEKAKTFDKKELHVIQSLIREIENDSKTIEIRSYLDERFIKFCAFLEDVKRESMKLLFQSKTFINDVNKRVESLSEKVFICFQRLNQRYDGYYKVKKQSIKKEYLEVKKKLISVLEKTKKIGPLTNQKRGGKQRKRRNGLSSENKESPRKKKKKIENMRKKKKNQKGFIDYFMGQDYEFFVFKRQIEFGKDELTKLRYKRIVLFEKNTTRSTVTYAVENSQGEKFNWSFKRTYAKLKKFEKIVVGCIQEATG